MSVRSSGRTRVRVLVIAAVAALSVPAIPAVAVAHDATCAGLQVTITDGGPGDDEIFGTPGPDVINGLGGNDVIYGGGGDDVICGGGGKDKIYGEDGNDLLIGGKGHDLISGGRGNDNLRGKAGNDRLSGKGGIDVAHGSTGADACRAEAAFNCEMTHRWGHDPEEWRGLVETHFGPLAETIGAPDLVDEAMHVMACESAGEPFNVNASSGASGLFQFLRGTWDRWNPQTAGWEGESIFHPEAHIATAARLVKASVDEGHHRWWQWSKACWP